MSAVAKIPKPQMRRLLETQLKKDMAIAIGTAITAAAAYKFFVADKRREAYAAFYR